MNNNSFFKKKLTFNENSIFFTFNEKINIVMDSCEDSLMERTAEILVDEGDDLLEVGFGMGIFASYAQKRKPKTHTIVEGHPQVYEKLKIWSEDKKNVNIIYGDWTTVIESINSMKYDSVYFDTHCDQNTYKFFHFIKDFLKPGGKFSRFGLDLSNNNLCQKEFDGCQIKKLVHEHHPVSPSEHVKYFTKNTFPICVVSL
jgi:protein arginine N-methyltransferase 2